MRHATGRSDYLTVVEHADVPVDESGAKGPTSVETESLLQLNRTRPGFCRRGYRSVKFGSHAGLVQLGTRTLEILPKTGNGEDRDGRGALLQLLRESDGFALREHLPTGHNTARAPLLDVFVAAFFDAVRDIARGGLLRRYRSFEDDLTVVRGRLDVPRQFGRLANRPDRIACAFDELSADNVWNRVLKHALRLTGPRVRSMELRRRWVELMALFDDVGDQIITTDRIDTLRFDRQALRYRVSIAWARLIIGVLTPRVRSGASEAPGLLFDMNALFQNAITSALRRRAPSGSRIRSSGSARPLATIVEPGRRKAFALNPDLLIERGGRIQAVADTKWKRPKVIAGGFIRPSEADVYQMHAYATTYDCDTAVLIYPWHDGLITSVETSYDVGLQGGGGFRLHVMSVDVAADSFQVMRGAETPPGRILDC